MSRQTWQGWQQNSVSIYKVGRWQLIWSRQCHLCLIYLEQQLLICASIGELLLFAGAAVNMQKCLHGVGMVPAGAGTGCSSLACGAIPGAQCCPRQLLLSWLWTSRFTHPWQRDFCTPLSLARHQLCRVECNCLDRRAVFHVSHLPHNCCLCNW